MVSSCRKSAWVDAAVSVVGCLYLTEGNYEDSRHITGKEFRKVVSSCRMSIGDTHYARGQGGQSRSCTFIQHYSTATDMVVSFAKACADRLPGPRPRQSQQCLPHHG